MWWPWRRKRPQGLPATVELWGPYGEMQLLDGELVQTGSGPAFTFDVTVVFTQPIEDPWVQLRVVAGVAVRHEPSLIAGKYRPGDSLTLKYTLDTPLEINLRFRQGSPRWQDALGSDH